MRGDGQYVELPDIALVLKELVVQHLQIYRAPEQYRHRGQDHE
jgi:hypothetical protein